MAFHVTHRWGAMEKAPCSSFAELLKELDTHSEDIEHSSVSVTHDSEWCLSVSKGGYVAFENLEEGEPRHMDGLSPEKVISLWHLLANGDLEALEKEPWQSGY